MFSFLLLMMKPIEREVITSAIKDHYDVISAASACEALAIVKEHTPNVIILDIEMPYMIGVEACSALKTSLTNRFEFYLHNVS
jgi:CheY-like chemotaxis protein